MAPCLARHTGLGWAALQLQPHQTVLPPCTNAWHHCPALPCHCPAGAAWQPNLVDHGWYFSVEPFTGMTIHGHKVGWRAIDCGAVDGAAMPGAAHGLVWCDAVQGGPQECTNQHRFPRQTESNQKITSSPACRATSSTTWCSAPMSCTPTCGWPPAAPPARWARPWAWTPTLSRVGGCFGSAALCVLVLARWLHQL